MGILRQALAIQDESIRKSTLLRHFKEFVPSYAPSSGGLGAFAESSAKTD